MDDLDQAKKDGRVYFKDIDYSLVKIFTENAEYKLAPINSQEGEIAIYSKVFYEFFGRGHFMGRFVGSAAFSSTEPNKSEVSLDCIGLRMHPVFELQVGKKFTRYVDPAIIISIQLNNDRGESENIIRLAKRR